MGFVLLLLCSTHASTQIPFLNPYPNTTILSGENVSISPSGYPANTVTITAQTTTDFTGVFCVNPTTGNIYVTNAYQHGTYVMAVRGYSAGGLNTTTYFTLTVNPPKCSSVVFNQITASGVFSSIAHSAIGDFNNDGKQDLVTTSQSGRFVTRLGNGNGTFYTHTEFGLPQYDRPGTADGDPIAIGDFNGDGYQDFALPDFFSSQVVTYFGNGSGGVQEDKIETPIQEGPVAVAVGDFNEDGRHDIVTVCKTSNGVSILSGSGSGSFFNQSAYYFGIAPEAIVVGDFNEDGHQDLAVSNSTSIRILIGQGNGYFTISGSSMPSPPAKSLVIGDFNEDGHQDLVVPNRNNDILSIYFGTGSGSFSTPTEISVGNAPDKVAIGDFNGDGHQDIVVSHVFNFDDAFLGVHLGNGNGTFEPALEMDTEADQESIAVGDFNGDGRHDIMATLYTNDYKYTALLNSDAELTVKGANVEISDGDITPTTIDHTDFGTVAVNGTLQRTFTLHSTGGGPLIYLLMLLL